MPAKTVAAEEICIRRALPQQRPQDSKHALSADSTTVRQGRASLRGYDRQTVARGADLRLGEVEVPPERRARRIVAARVCRSAVIYQLAETHGGMEAPLGARQATVLEPLRCRRNGGSSTGSSPEVRSSVHPRVADGAEDVRGGLLCGLDEDLPAADRGVERLEATITTCDAVMSGVSSRPNDT